MPSKLTIEEVKNNLMLVHSLEIILDESTYIDMIHKARFIDKDYGEWWASPNNVINQKNSHMLRRVAKRKITNLKKYGTTHANQNKVIKEKIKKTNMKRYGVENLSQNKEMQQKKIQTYLKKFGVNNPSKSLEIKEKKKRTLFANYGIDNPMHNRDLALKNAKSQRYTCKLFHWKTNEELVCVGSYEKKVVEWLNKNKIDFRWQSQVFKMPNGKTYRPDLYLVVEDRWVEIKGYFRKNSAIKWDWFRGIRPNSELWDKDKLKEMKIL